MTSVAVSSPTVQEINDQVGAALHTMRLRAVDTYPAERARIDRGHMLALSGYVTLQDDGTATVLSGSLPDTWYHVNGFCPCRDYVVAPRHRCKHKWAKALLTKAYTALHQHREEPLEDTACPYSFPDTFTTFAATYVGHGARINGTARRVDDREFSFTPEGLETGTRCAYQDVALGPGIA
jgi:hypothetical protein